MIFFYKKPIKSIKFKYYIFYYLDQTNFFLKNDPNRITNTPTPKQKIR